MTGVECPDTGACHHECVAVCWRVHNAAPLSLHGERWTEEEKRRHSPLSLREQVTAAHEAREVAYQRLAQARVEYVEAVRAHERAWHAEKHAARTVGAAP